MLSLGPGRGSNEGGRTSSRNEYKSGGPAINCSTVPRFDTVRTQAGRSQLVNNRQRGSDLRASPGVSGAVDPNPPVQSYPTRPEVRRFANASPASSLSVTLVAVAWTVIHHHQLHLQIITM